LWIFGGSVEIDARARCVRDETCLFLQLCLLVVFEIFDLTQALGGFFARLVWSAKIFSFFGSDFISRFHFLDHGYFPPKIRLTISLLGHQYGLRCMQSAGDRALPMDLTQNEIAGEGQNNADW
jgi:hypothetical protein